MYILYRSPAAFYELLITVVITLFRSTAAPPPKKKKKKLYYLLPAESSLPSDVSRSSSHPYLFLDQLVLKIDKLSAANSQSGITHSHIYTYKKVK